MSNLPGPGHLLGNLYSSAGSFLEQRLGKLAGSFLEQRLGKLAYRAGLGSYAKAETDLANFNLWSMLKDDDMVENEKACNILLEYARYDTSLYCSFRMITHVAGKLKQSCHTNHSPSLKSFTTLYASPSLRSVAEMVCQKRNEHIDIVTFSWKRPGVEYDSSCWLSYYNAASRCFSMHSDSVMGTIARFRATEHSPLLDFSGFEEILACCR